MFFFFFSFFRGVVSTGAQKLESEPLEYEDPNDGVAMVNMGQEDDSGSSEVRRCIYT